MLDITQLDTDLANLIDELPSVLVVEGKTILCAKGEKTVDETTGELGISLDYDVNVLFRASLLPSWRRGRRVMVTLDGESYRVVRSAESADGVQLRFYLTKETARAAAI